MNFVLLSFLVFFNMACTQKRLEPMEDFAEQVVHAEEQPALTLNDSRSSVERLTGSLKKRGLSPSDFEDVLDLLERMHSNQALDANIKYSPALNSYVRSSLFPSHLKVPNTQGAPNAATSNISAGMPLSVINARNAIQMARDADDRLAIKRGYLQLVRAYEKDLPQDQISIVDNYLWLARYEALFAEYTESLSSLRKALINISRARKNRSYSQKQQAQINDLEIEVHFTRASRIHIEQNNINAARQSLEQASKIKPRTKEWDERLLWFQGLYAYMEADWIQALRYWETQLATTQSHDLKQSLLYWIAKTYKDLNNLPRSQENLFALEKLDPTSFYLLTDPNYRLPVSGENSLTQSLPFDTKDPLHKIHQLIYALIESDLNDIAFFYIQDFQKQLVNQYGFKPATVQTFLYVARLYIRAQSYLHGISLSTEVLRAFPEAWLNHKDQLSYYYPLAYLDLFKKGSVPPPISLAITRQESGFNPRAASSAGAYGLMQMIAKTAERYIIKQGSHQGVPPNDRLKQLAEDPKKILFVPEQSISLGTLYLQELMDRYNQESHFAYAAYNAGEFAVDQWAKNRKISDPLLWIELIPFAQTRHYVKSVTRNERIYKILLQDQIVQNHLY